MDKFSYLAAGITKYISEKVNVSEIINDFESRNFITDVGEIKVKRIIVSDFAERDYYDEIFKYIDRLIDG